MTENEAIKILNTEKHCLNNSTKGICKINCGECKENIPIAYQEKAYEAAITALGKECILDIGLDAMNADVNLPIMTHRNKRQKHGTGGQVSRMSDDLISRKAAEQQLMDSFLRWEYIYTHGCSDPFYEDGYNINLVRNHIIYGKRKLEELGYLPEIYGRETHPEVDNKYMARADEIRQHARQTLARYKADENLRYLIKNAHKASREEAKQISLNRVLRYAYGLEDFIKTDSLVDMRRHENPERYLESFKSCREELQRILEKPGNQEMTLITEEQTGQLRFV